MPVGWSDARTLNGLLYITQGDRKGKAMFPPINETIDERYRRIMSEIIARSEERTRQKMRELTGDWRDLEWIDEEPTH